MMYEVSRLRGYAYRVGKAVVTGSGITRNDAARSGAGRSSVDREKYAYGVTRIS